MSSIGRRRRSQTLLTSRPVKKSNICYQFKLRRGDVDKAFAAADRVFEDTFSSPPAQHLPMEPHVTLVYLDENQRINVWTASQTPSYVRTELSNTFGIPMNRIRVRIPYLGAAMAPSSTPVGAAGYGTGFDHKKPVRYALTREEEFLTITSKGDHEIKTAVKNGVITARKCEVFWDTGAYAEIGPRVCTNRATLRPVLPHSQRLDRFDCVYTNHRARGRVSRVWRAAGDLGLRLADGHRRARHRRGRRSSFGWVTALNEGEALHGDAGQIFRH